MPEESKADHPLRYFEQVYVINLKSRADRRAQLLEEFRRHGVPTDIIHWFDAIRPDDKGEFESIGARGCFMSHLGVLDLARDSAVQSVLILEDDVQFSADFTRQLAQAVEELRSTDWDVFYGGGRVGGDVSPAGSIAEVSPDIGIVCAHFVAFRTAKIGALHDYISRQLTRRDGDPLGGPMHVDGSYSWARREMQLRTYMATPEIATQRSSRSDISPQGGIEKIPGMKAVNDLRRWIVRQLPRR